MTRIRPLWIAWHAHRRTVGLCEAWSVPLRVIGSGSRGLLISIGKAIETLRILHRERPEILFVPNPSLGLTVLAYVVRPLFGYRLVVDAHNEGVRPFDRPGAFVRRLTRRLLRAADATIVTNEALARDVLEAGGRPLVLPDHLPVPPAALTESSAGPMESSAAGGAPDRSSASSPEGDAPDAPSVVVIATFRRDEPIAAIVEAAAQLPEVSFAFTGEARKFHAMRIRRPPNVRLAGFLPDEAYWALLSRAAIVCDLTLKPDCLVCGAYEALALAKPMVLSEGPATRKIFGTAAVLAGAAPDEIATALREAVEQRRNLAAAAGKLRESYRAQWRERGDAVWEEIRTLGRASATEARA